MKSQIAPPRLHFRVPPEPSHLLRARERVRDYLHQYCADRQVVDDTVLCVEEACTNAIRHSGSADDIEIAVSFAATEVVATVKDHGRAFDLDGFDPGVTPDTRQDHGRGLFIVAALMDSLELRVDGGLEVRMARRAASCPEPLRFDSGLGIALAGALAGGNARMRAVLEKIDEGFVALDWEYRYTHVNEAMLRLMGRPRDEVIGKVLWELFPGLARTPVQERCRAAMELGRPSVVEHRSLLSGTWFEMRIYPTSAGVSIYFRDIDERKQTEEDLRASEARVRRIARAGRIGFVEWNAAQDTSYWSAEHYELFGYAPGSPISWRAWLAGVYPDDRERVAQNSARLLERGRTEGQVRGHVDEYRFTRPDGVVIWLESDMSLDMVDGEPIVRGSVRDVTERKAAEEALRASDERFRSLFEHMSHAGSLNELVRDADGRPCDVRFLEVNPAFERQTGLSAADVVGRTIHGLYDVDEAAWLRRYEEVVRTGQPAHFEERFGPLDRWLEVWAYRTGPDRFATLSDDITERKRAERARDEAARLGEALNAIDALVHSSLHAEETIQTALREGAQAIGAEQAGLSLHEDDARRFRVAYLHNHPPDKVGILISDSQDIHGVEAMRTGKTVAVDDAQSDPRVVPALMEAWRIKSVICAPLVVQGKPIGVVYYSYSSASHRFSAAEIDFMTKLASSLSTAVENATLYEAQRDIAITLQESILPTPPRLAQVELGIVGLPAVRAALVGGDFWDVFELPDKKLLVVIGDVAGKGIGAAALTETVRATMRAFATLDDSPAFILRKTNDLLLTRKRDELFVTALVVVMDPDAAQITMGSAGHPGPMHLTPLSCATIEPAYGPPLGCFAWEYSSRTADLAPDEYLVLYTDGVTEARRSGRMFGEQGLSETLGALHGERAQDVADALASAASSYADALNDDVQVLVVRRRRGAAQRGPMFAG